MRIPVPLKDGAYAPDYETLRKTFWLHCRHSSVAYIGWMVEMLEGFTNGFAAYLSKDTDPAEFAEFFAMVLPVPGRSSERLGPTPSPNRRVPLAAGPTGRASGSADKPITRNRWLSGSRAVNEYPIFLCTGFRAISQPRCCQSAWSASRSALLSKVNPNSPPPPDRCLPACATLP